MNEIIRFGESRQEKGMTSLQIADAIGRRHSDVMRDIRKFIERGANERNFALVEYCDKKGESRPMYNLTPKGCLILASGYDVVLREKIIDKLEEYRMKERSVVSLPDFSNPAEAARAWAEQFEQKQIETKRADEAESQVLALTQEIETMQPKVVFADAVVGSSTNILVRDLAKLIQQNGCNIGEVRMYRWLREKKYLALNNRPMQRYMEQGLFFISEGTHSENGVLKSHFTTKVTPKGQQYFLNLFINNNALCRQ